MQIATPKSATGLTIFLGIIILFSAVSIIAANAAFMVRDEIYSGVTVGDIPVGGLSVRAAQQKILGIFKERTGKSPIILIYQDQSWPVSSEDIELNIDAVDLANQAYNVGRTGNIFNRLQERFLVINHGHFLPLIVNYNQDKLTAIINTIAKSINREPRNASLKQSGSEISIIPEVTGRKVDVAKTIADITSQLNNHISFTAKITVNEAMPLIVPQDFADIDGVIATYTTQFDPSNDNRVQNIILAAQNINNILVHPGEVLSFNTSVGPRLAEYGYKEAPAFISGKLVPDWGGGVCQVTSTLYNAVLLADMEIVERTSHYRPPGYVPLGRDATVADNLLDFKFKNNSPYNIYISSELAKGSITINIYGKRGTDKADIQILATNKRVLEPNTIIKQDPAIELGREVIEVEGQSGFQITTYRIKKMNGQEVSREFLATDEFPPEDRVLRVGTKVPAHPVQPNHIASK